MKLTKEHIGKKVRSSMWLPGEWLLIQWLEGKYCAGVDEKGDAFAERIEACFSQGWEIVEPKKKPSERIKEIYIKNGGDPFSADIPEICQVIIEYLDEMAQDMAKGEKGS